MKGSEIFHSKYLKAEELDGDMTMTIAKVVLETLENNEGVKQDKPVIYFHESDKGLVVNKTNWGTISRQYGDESDDWIKKEITLRAMDVEAFGQMKLAIRVIPPRKKPAAPAPRPNPSTPGPALAEGDEAITAYWLEVKKQGLERKQGLELLNKHGQDFAKALAALGDDSVPF